MSLGFTLKTGFEKPGVSVGRSAQVRALCVADPCAQGFDPVRFIDGPGANDVSGLSFSYAANVSYSSDPGPAFTYGYPPSPDSGGYDAAVTSVRIAPSGSGNPGFNLELRVRVQ
jgi:hypothetical protein